jgi:hypothetical protein
MNFLCCATLQSGATLLFELMSLLESAASIVVGFPIVHHLVDSAAAIDVVVELNGASLLEFMSLLESADVIDVITSVCSIEFTGLLESAAAIDVVTSFVCPIKLMSLLDLVVGVTVGVTIVYGLFDSAVIVLGFTVVHHSVSISYCAILLPFKTVYPENLSKYHNTLLLSIVIFCLFSSGGPRSWTIQHPPLLLSHSFSRLLEVS